MCEIQIQPSVLQAAKDDFIDDDSLKFCSHCMAAKHPDEFKERGKEFKLCNPCRNKPKQQLIALKEALAGGKSIICCVCKVEQELNDYIHIKHSSKV